MLVSIINLFYLLLRLIESFHLVEVHLRAKPELAHLKGQTKAEVHLCNLHQLGQLLAP